MNTFVNKAENVNDKMNDKIKSGISQIRPSTGNIENDLAALREDIVTLAETVGRLGSSSVKNLKNRAMENFDSLKESGSDVAGYLKTHGSEMEKQLVETVRDRPLVAIAAAASIGLLIGLITKK